MTAWLAEARRLVGTREVRGAGSNSVIMGWVRNLGARVLGIQVNDDTVPWCGTFAAHCMTVAGIKPPAIAVRAMAWADWGANLREANLVEGAVMVFQRKGGGHVGFLVAHDATHYHILGGNQSDAVNVMRIAKSRCVARRWPRGVGFTSLVRASRLRRCDSKRASGSFTDGYCPTSTLVCLP